jgi:hypothetical protein
VRTSLLAKIGQVDISSRSRRCLNFRIPAAFARRSLRQAQLRSSSPLRIGRTILPASASFHG